MKNLTPEPKPAAQAREEDSGLTLTVQEFLRRRPTIKSTMGRAFAFHVEQKEPGAKKLRGDWDRLMERFSKAEPK